MAEINYREIVEYGTKAPSGHNSQPWKFKILEGAIEIYPDLSRSLPAVDPHMRELFISLGCATENIVLAAKAQGLNSQVEISPDAESVSVRFSPSSSADSHWLSLIDERQSNRSVYSNDPLTEIQLGVLRNLPLEQGVNATIVTDGTQKAQLVDLVRAGNDIQMRDPALKAELISWMRLTNREVRTRRDGLAYDAMGIPELPFGVFAKMLVRRFLSPKRQNRRDDRLLQSASAFVVFSVDDNIRASWISLGRYFERIALTATALGLAHSHFNQPFEAELLREHIDNLDFIHGEYPCMMIRLGRATPMPRSPRRLVQDAIIK